MRDGQVNTVLRSLDFQDGDEVLSLNLAYSAVRNTLRFVRYNVQQMVQLVEVNVELPLKDFASLVDVVAKVQQLHLRP